MEDNETLEKVKDIMFTPFIKTPAQGMLYGALLGSILTYVIVKS
jgi:hypothetical protein